MTIPGNSLIRNSPFVQNDKRMLADQTRLIESSQRLSSTQREPSHSFTQVTTTTLLGSSSRIYAQDSVRIDYSPISSSNFALSSTFATPTADPADNEITYGPGIVQKLCAKFSQIANMATESVEISPHSRRKRFPSVDDILFEDEHKRFSRFEYRSINYSCGNLSAQRDQSLDALDKISPKTDVLNDLSKCILNVEIKPQLDDATEKMRSQALSDEIKDEEPKQQVQISALREKFERYSKRHESIADSKAKVAAVASRPAPRSRSAVPQVDDTEEPEFIRVQRMLRRSGSRDELQADIAPMSQTYRSRILSPVNSESNRITEEKQMAPSLPRLKGTARVVVETNKDEWKNASGAPLPLRVSELINPPDPDSARLTLSELIRSPHYEATELSPPPEEPKPTSNNEKETEKKMAKSYQNANGIMVDGDTHLILSPTSLKTPLTSSGDGSGLNEMHRLLSKFNVIREQKTINDSDQSDIKKLSNETVDKQLSNLADSLEITPQATINSKVREISQHSLANPLNRPTTLTREISQHSLATPLIRPTTLIEQLPLGASSERKKDLTYRSSNQTTQIEGTQYTSPTFSPELILLSPDAQLRPFDSTFSGENSTTSEESAPRPESVLNRQVVNQATSESKPSEPEEKTCVPLEPVASRLEFVSHVNRESPQSQVVSPAAYSSPPKSRYQVTESTVENKRAPSSSFVKPSSLTPSSVSSASSTTTSVQQQITPTTSLTSPHSDFIPSPPQAPSRTAPLPPEHRNDTQRRSLTAKFLESKSHQIGTVKSSGNIVDEGAKSNQRITEQSSPVNEKAEVGSSDNKKAVETSKTSVIRGAIPEGQLKKDEHPTELQIMLEKFSRQRIADGVDFDDDSDSPIMVNHHLSGMTAGDGNPVRHSLISLVMEEDVPMLMEAMAEKLNFVFEDLLSTPSSSNEGIIRNKAKREERRKMRSASKIDFVSTPPAVFTYPDEMTAVEYAEWHPGEHITFDQYQKICEIERERCEQQKRELSKWHASIIAGRSINADTVVSAHPVSPTASDYQLGVTSRISYNTPPVVSNGVEFKSTTMSLIAGK
uniref:Uncharacterized protein n=1 Tax=Parascaris univalens TaxID=6257 RepID=A0A914ZBX9_PARUN